MSTLPVFLHFGGVWDESNKYVDYRVRGIVVPLDCSFSNLVTMVAVQLGKDEAHYDFKMNYQVYDKGPRIPICDDSTLFFYVELKRGEMDKRLYPICVDVDVDVMPNCEVDIMTVGALHEESINCNSNSLTHKSIEQIDDGNIDLIAGNPTLEEMGMQLADYMYLGRDDDEDAYYSVITSPLAAVVKKGTVFKNKEILVTSFAMWSFEKRFQHSVVKSDSKFYWLNCAEKGCNWKFKSSRTGCVGNFKIREMNDTHTCSTDSVIAHHRQSTSTVIANCIKHKFNSTRRIYTPRDIIDDMHHTYGIIVSYDKAWRARDRAIQMIRGDPYESFGKLSAYMHRLKVANPGSITRIEVDEYGRFLFSFIALGASIFGWEHCKPVIVVDGTFLTGKHGGTLFTASTQDANNNIFILAFGVGDSENNNAWEWFLLRVKEAYGKRNGLCIVSDRHRSIVQAVANVFPDSHHGACTYHLLQNLKKEFGQKGKGIRVPFNAASRAYTIANFDNHMAKLDAINPGIRGYLKDVGYDKWSRAHMTTDRYSTMTSNIAESVNSAIKYAKDYPIDALFESLRCTIQRWFSRNRNDAMSTFTKLASRHNKMMKEMILMSRKLRVLPSSDTIYEVKDEDLSFVVDMSERTCSCRRFQIDHIPCQHAAAVIAMQNYTLSDYCSIYFTKEEYIAAYKFSVYPLGNTDDWEVPDEVKQMVVIAPKSKRGPGRPKENRYKSYLEYKRRTRCGKCDGYGHNSRTCHNPAAMVARRPSKRKKSSGCT